MGEGGRGMCAEVGEEGVRRWAWKVCGGWRGNCADVGEESVQRWAREECGGGRGKCVLPSLNLSVTAVLAK